MTASSKVGVLVGLRLPLACGHKRGALMGKRRNGSAFARIQPDYPEELFLLGNDGGRDVTCTHVKGGR